MDMLTHSKSQHWHCQGKPDPELERKRTNFVTLMFVRAAGPWCKSHPAFWAFAGMILFDLRMHWTSVDSHVPGHWRHWLQSHPTLWADTRFIGDYLRMHGTRILKTAACRGRGSAAPRLHRWSAVVMTRISGCTMFH